MVFDIFVRTLVHLWRESPDRIKIMKSFYWISFAISILTILLNMGLFLMLTSFILLPSLVLHAYIGVKLKNIKGSNIWIILSAISLLIFSLVRIDGVHVSENGFTALMHFLGFHIYFNDSELEEPFLVASLLTLVFQVIIDIILVKKVRDKEDLSAAKSF